MLIITCKKQNKKSSDNQLNVDVILYISEDEATWPVEMLDLVDENKYLLNSNKRKIAEKITDPDMTIKLRNLQKPIRM